MIKTCPQCHKDITQKSKQSNSDYKNQIYCSRSCANRHNPRRKRLGKCKDCSAPIKSGWLRCSDCHKLSIIDYSSLTLLDFKALHKKSSDKYGLNWRNHLQQNAVKVMKNANIPKVCASCGYDKIVHVCHLTPKTSFSDSSLVGEINALDNLIYLCPNHHWELDHHC